MRNKLVTMIVASLSVVAACGSSPRAQDTRPAAGDKPAGVAGDPSCPLLVPGTSISVEDSPQGPALVFVTTGDVAAVRTRGQALATMHNAHDGAPEAMGMMLGAKSNANAADIEGGVRVTFTPTDPAAADAVGNELRMHAGHLAGASSCAMHM